MASIQVKLSGNLFLFFEILHDVKYHFFFAVAAKCAAVLHMRFKMYLSSFLSSNIECLHCLKLMLELPKS